MIDEAMTNIREAIDMCIDEISEGELNTFVGFREMEIEQNA
jgi:predicted RNase H-like HicB family nuclease